MSDGTTPVDFSSMSDEDFMNLAGPEAAGVEAPAVVVEEPVITEQGNGEQEQVQTEGTNETEGTQGEEGQGGGNVTGTEGAEGDNGQAKTEEQPKQEGAEAKPAEGAVPPLGSEKEKVEAPAVDHEAFFKQVMAPFKANGKTIELKTPEEVIQLMQMGANYTRKMQDIQPHRKVLTMLQNADLLDEGKLDLLIAVSKKDPEAIKRIIKDAGIDPLDIDANSEPTYVEGSHLVSDTEVAFNSAVEDMMSTDGGVETLQTIRTTWDQASKDAVWKDPTLLRDINIQRSNGLYDLIAGEVERLRILGQIPAETSFIKAYQVVGDHMSKNGGFDSLIQKQQQEQQGKTAGQPSNEPVAVKAEVPKAQVDNDERAAAAAGNRGTAKPAKVATNYFAMSDEEFMKVDANFQGRL